MCVIEYSSAYFIFFLVRINSSFGAFFHCLMSVSLFVTVCFNYFKEILLHENPLECREDSAYKR